MNIVIAGLGRYTSGIEECLQKDVNIEYYLDNAINKRNKKVNGKMILSHHQCYTDHIDYVVIGIMGYESFAKELKECGFSANQIIPFFDPSFNLHMYESLFILEKAVEYSLRCNMFFLQRRIEKYEQEQRFFAEHFVYEMIDAIQKDKLKLPKICSVDETGSKILRERASISRYGDGEFEIIFGNAKDIYQDDNLDLAMRLREILKSDVDNHLVALADDYGDISDFREENQKNIRTYMTIEKRMAHYQCLDMNKQYYNAYISRPYVIYPHDKRCEAERRFNQLKEIWRDEEILMVEGELTRMGVGNDLFERAKSVQRIIAPNKNAYNKYNEILEWTKFYGRGKLILIALGPTATVLAYDLAKEGYWAIDIGHLDLEYEWFLKGEGYSYIPQKYNNEVPGDDEVTQICDMKYEKSIIKRIPF